MAGFDPTKANEALTRLGSTYRVPVPAQVASVPAGVSPVGGLPVDTLEALSPAEQAFAQRAAAAGDEQRTQDALADMTRMPGVAHEAPQALPSVGAGTPSLEWQPPTPPAARVQSVNPFQTQGVEGPARAPLFAQPRAGAANPRSPIAGMAKDAGFRAEEERIAAEEAQAGIDTAVAGQQDAIRRQAQAQEEGGKAQEALLLKASALQQRQAREAMDADADQAAIEAGKLTNMEKDAEEIGKFEVKDRRTAGTKAMAAIAIGLGELGAGISRAFGVGGQQNTALQIINDGVEKSLQAQEALLNNKKTALGAKQTALGIAQARYKDAKVARQYAHELETAGTIKELEAAKAKAGSPEAKAVADGLIARLSEGLHGSQLARHQSLYDRDLAQAQQLRLAKYDEEKRAASGGRQDLTMEQLEYLVKNKQATADQQKSYAEAKNKLEVDGKGHLSDGDKKLARLAAGVEPAYKHLLKYTGADAEIPYFGVREGTEWIPDVTTPKETLLFRASNAAIDNVLLRDESGASISDSDIAAKKRSWGEGSGDPEIRKEGMRRKLAEFEARRANGVEQEGLSGTAATSKVRKGAVK